jgi:signal transduction histidine kinase
MFRNLSTGTKIFILCGVFIVAIAIPIYSLIAEKRAALEFARKELTGSRYLAALRGTYAAILISESSSANSFQQSATPWDEVLEALAAAEADAGGITQTAELQRTLTATLRELWFAKDARTPIETFTIDALAVARNLASRIGDDSNLAIDPGLDSYYLQDLVIEKLPNIMGQLGEVQILAREAVGALSAERRVRLLMLDGLLRSAAIEVKRDLAAAYRANIDGNLKHALDAEMAEMVLAAGQYLNTINADLINSDAKGIDAGSIAGLYSGAVQSGLKAWTAAHAELDRLLNERIADLDGKMRHSLLLTGALAILSVLVAIITHRSIVPRLRRLERVAREVSETKNYDLRTDSDSKDEIGRLAMAFNDMLSELAAARHRESSNQLELARVARLTAAGAMTASIAHEINQPLAAIVSNGSAGLHWLRKVPPNFREVETTLKQIVSDGNRASEVIGSIRLMFKADGQVKALVDVNDLIRQTLTLVRAELRSKGVISELELLDHLPQVSGNRVQLQQVILNLIMNAMEAMGSVAERTRVLRVKSDIVPTQGVVVTVEDSGPGIDVEDMDRVFDAFFTTKSQGMGMGLSICRSIIEAHSGRIWASHGDPHGTIFNVVLPADGLNGG